MSHLLSRIRSPRSLSGIWFFAAGPFLVSAITLTTWALDGSPDGGSAPRPISVRGIHQGEGRCRESTENGGPRPGGPEQGREG